MSDDTDRRNADPMEWVMAAILVMAVAYMLWEKATVGGAR